MALAQAKEFNVGQCGSIVSQPVGSLGCSVVAHTDLTDANSAGELLQPFSAADAGQGWIARRLQAGYNRIKLVARYTKTATVTTSPVVRVVGAFPTNSSVTLGVTGDPLAVVSASTFALPNDGTWQAKRLDNTTASAAGLTLTLVSSGTGLYVDSTYAYADATAEIDLQDAPYWMVLVETAASVSAGAVVCYAHCYT